MNRRRTIRVLAAVSLALLAGCGGSDGDAGTDTDPVASASDPSTEGVRLVSVTDGAAIAADPPPDLVVLDVRTPDEYAAGHLEDAVVVDFYEDDFASRIAELDPDVPYLLYCRSGNRSGQTRALMDQLGFTDVADVDGGILAWADADLPIITD